LKYKRAYKTYFLSALCVASFTSLSGNYLSLLPT